MDALGRVCILNLTATPVRTDGRGLGHVYEEMVCSPSVAELTELGYLVPMRYFVGEIPNLRYFWMLLEGFAS